MVRKIFQSIVLVAAVLVVARVGAAFVWPTINDVTTGGTPQYPDLRPQRFDRPIDHVFDAALETARALGWEVTAKDRDHGEIQAVATTTVLHFKDDVTI